MPLGLKVVLVFMDSVRPMAKLEQVLDVGLLSETAQ